jgi:ATP-dependent Clp protease ATP-binding subunit ClpC
MYERYTENARRAISLARNEAVGAGSPEIDTLHLLLGIVTADRALMGSLLGMPLVDLIQEQILLKSKRAAPASKPAEPPLTNECNRILKHAEEQADSLSSAKVGGEHLLLGVLCEPGTMAGKILKKQGLEHSALRQKLGGEVAAPASSGLMGKLKRTFGLG